MTDTTYNHKPNGYFAQSRSEMVGFIPAHTQTILEIGCGGGEFMKHLRQTRKVHAVAIEPHKEAAEQARNHFDTVIEADVAAGLNKLKNERFDCVVVNDVLEHLVAPWETLVAIRKLLSPHGVAVASIPNVRYFPVLRALALNGRWDYADYGVLDRTHLRFFTQSSIREMFETSGYCVERLEGINSMSLTWKHNILFFLLGERLVDTKYQQFACVARNIP